MLGVTSDRPGGAFFSDDTVAQGSNGIVVVRDIDFASTNLSTLLPFHGRAHIGYVPSAGVVLGLSKLARLTKHFGKKLQSQAKLATDIASCLQTHLQCQASTVADRHFDYRYYLGTCLIIEISDRRLSLRLELALVFYPQGIAVYIEARQITPLCVEASRREACIGGCFAEDPAQFQEFLALLNMSAPSSSNIHYLPSSKPSSSDSTQLLMTPTALSEDDSIEATNGSADSSRSQGVMLRSESYASDLASSAEAKSNPNMAKMEQAINRMILEIEEDPFSTVSSIELVVQRFRPQLESVFVDYHIFPMQNLSKSASRYALGLLESTQGYTAPLPTRKDALVPASQSDLTVDSVTLSGAEGATTVVTASFIFNSQCEHHMLPFYGQTMVAYVPPAGSSPRLLSRSALEQVVRVYTRRLQVQERITHQLADAVADLAMPDGVMVSVRGHCSKLIHF